MAKPGIIYRLNWQAFHESVDIQLFVDIADNDNLIDDAADPVIYDLQPAGEPARLSVIDNDDNPFKVIRAQQLTLQFINTSVYNLNTFATGSDNRWSVHYYQDIDTQTIFKGYLVLDDIYEALMPYGYEVVLTATDNLGLLKEDGLTKSDGTVPVGYYKIIDILSMCLAKTGLSLDIRAAFNIKLSGFNTDISVQNSTDEHFFSNVYLDIKSFEDETNKLLPPYEIIEKILGFEACLFQTKGQWWIMRIDEVEDLTRGLYITSFDADGTFDENRGQFHFDKSIGITEDIKLAEESSTVTNVRPKKEVRLDYDYEHPSIPFNSNFELGDLNNTVSSTEKWYDVDGWFMAKAFPSGPTPFTVGSNAYIKRIFNSFGQESERYAVITSPSVNSALTCKLVSQAIPVHEGDKLEVSVDFRFSAGISSGTLYYNILNVVFLQDNGTWWLHGRDESGNSASPIWYDTSNWSANTNKGQQLFDFNNLDETGWMSQSTEVTSLPGNGKLYIWLNSLNTSALAADDLDIYYNNLSVTYKPRVANSIAGPSGSPYRTLKSQYHKTSQSGDYRAKLKENVYISDSFKRLLRGALHKIDSYSTIIGGIFAPGVSFTNTNSFSIVGFYLQNFEIGQILVISGTSSNNMTTRVTGVSYHILTSSTQVDVEGTTVTETALSAIIESPVFELTDGFYNAAVFPTGPPTSAYIHPYGEIQLFDVWNQYKNDMRVLNIAAQGCDLDLLDGDGLTDIACLLNKWAFTDTSLNLENRFFQLLSFDQNHDTQGWATGVFREVVNTTKNKDYSNHEFAFVDG